MSGVEAETRGTRTATSERRPLTVLFADIAGSTAIAERMDPEDWTQIVGEVFARMNRTVERYGGTVARLMGDGLLAFFGAPVAHEDDPERAVRCGLEMVRAVDDLAATREGAPARIRVGINTGPVVVGVVGTDTAHEYTAMGDAVNVAARMQSLAEPGGVLITAATHRFVAELIEVRDLGPLEVKGKSETVHVYQVSGVKPGAVQLRGLAGIRAPMIGRARELARLRELFAVAKAGQGRLACVLGEPGIGKSRLLAELREATVAAEPGTRWIEGRCVSYGQGLPYYLVLEIVRSAIGMTPSASEPEVRDALRRVASEVIGDEWAETYAYLGHLLSLDLEPEAKARLSSLEFEAVKRYVAALIKLLRGLAARGPLVVVCDDVHWADRASVDALFQVMPLLAEVPVLCVLASRVERDAEGWRLITGARDVFGDALAELALEPLSREDSTALVASLLRIESLPAATRERVLAKAEGNPFFVEEVIRMLLDRGAIVREGERWIATDQASDIAIPDTLQGLLLARIDRLPAESRRAIRVASVIGRQFGVKVLERLLETAP